MLPHRAVYEMSLGKSSGSSGVVSVRGTLLLTWEETCEAWLVGQRLFLKVSRDDATFATSSAFDTVESKDGLDFSFEDRTVREPGGAEFASGSARLASQGGDGSLVLDEPEPGQFVLPKGTMFPTAQLIDILARAEAGERIINHLVYDGTDGAVLFDVTTVLAEPKTQTLEGEAGGEATIWPMRLAYYPHDTVDPLPQVEIGADVQDNGVAHRLVFDYGTFTVESELTELEPLPRPDCP